MRLTLRNMLAHMDGGIPDPEDDEDIRKRIADSEFATNLMHRIRDVMRRLRLGTPGLGHRGPGLDPNTVAEYLDHVLPDDEVEDFEKACLQSDMQLAEVAAAHQVLTLAQVEPVEIDPAARERMYRLPEVAVEAEQAAEVRRREKPAVPEYLRDPPRKRVLVRALAVLVLAGCVLVAVWAATDGFGVRPDRAGPEPAEPQVAVVPPAPEAPAKPEEAVEPQERPEVERVEPIPPGEPVEEVAPEEPPAEADRPVTPTEAEPLAPAPEPAPRPGDVLPPVPAPDDAPAEAPEPVPPPGVEAPDDLLEPAPELPPGEPVVEPRPEPEPQPAIEDLIPGLQAPVAPEGPPPPAERPERATVGRLVSDRQLLLQFDEDRELWNRVAMQTAIKPEYPLLALPTYRPVVALTAGFAVQLVGPAQVELHPIDGGDVQTLEIDYGRLTMHTLGRAGTEIRLAFGGRTGTLTFAEAESGVAVHVGRRASPGEDPENETAPVVASLWTTRGSAVWQTDGGEPVKIGTSEHVVLDSAAEPPEPRPAGAPAWVGEDQTSFLDRRASDVLVEELQAGRPAALVLREVAVGHRQREVRWLAVRCLGYLGHFDLTVSVLDEEDSRTVWFDYIDELRAVLARGPRLAAAVREALEKHYGADAEILYRMLWGYSADDLRNGAVAALVDALEHERLAVRVLSFWNLRELTGLGLFYRPEHPAARRQQPVQHWRERLASGEIVRRAEERGLQ